MSSDRLREAARVLRGLAEAAPPGPWGTQAGTDGNPADGPTTYTLTAPTGAIATGGYDSHDGCALDYASTVHPGVGLALANWLDDLAAGWPWDDAEGDGIPTWDDGMPMRLDESVDSRALALAYLILGGTP